MHCLNKAAEAKGLHRGMSLADARAIYPALTTRLAYLPGEAAALTALHRWAGRYSPMVARDGSGALISDVTGVPHLFGGEVALRADIHARLERAGYSVSTAIAETRGAAWALARHGGGVASEGSVAGSIGNLPVSALRVNEATVQGLTHMGLIRISDLIPLDRAPLARRFGKGLLLRLDQALGAQPEPVAPETGAPHFGVRMTFPEPIGLKSDVMAALLRLLKRLCETLTRYNQGARRLRLELHRVDRETTQVEIGLARVMRDSERISALFEKGVEQVEAGFGIEAIRLCAHVTEELRPEQLGGGANIRQEDGLADLFTRLGNRVGFDKVQRLLPAESKIPERSFIVAVAAYSQPEAPPRRRGPERPIMIFPPEPIMVSSMNQPGHSPARFRWRGMSFRTLRAMGPERIAPEWWFDDPAWRSGLRDYWRVETREGPRLWLFYTPQAPAWSVQGEFA